MTERIREQKPSFDLNPFVELPKKQEPKPDHIHGLGDRAAIEKALRDQGAAEYVDRPKTPGVMLAEAFAKKASARGPRCQEPRRPPPDIGASGFTNVAEFQKTKARFAVLEQKHTHLTQRLEKSVRDWQAAAKQIARTEKDPVARQQKVQLAQNAATRAKAELREQRVQFGIVAHEYKVALGLEKRVAIGPSKREDTILPPEALKQRTDAFEKRIDTVANSGLIAPIAAFLYVVLTEASGRSLDSRDYAALDKFYAVGKQGEGMLDGWGKAQSEPKTPERASTRPAEW